MEKINSFEWFEQLLGFTEKKWNYKMETLPNFVLEQAGNFETKSIKELKENINLTNKEKIKPLRFIFRKKKTKENEGFFDTSELQYNAQEGTLFQVASNFNCMELGSEFRSAFSGKHITQLMVDQTQGPSAAGGAVYGTMLRISKHKEKEITMLLQVHDELIFEVDENKVSDYAKIIKNLMENAYHFQVPIIAEASAGNNWNELEKISL